MAARQASQSRVLGRSPSVRDKKLPAYARVENYLHKLIAEGAGRSAPLPTEMSLAELFGVNRMTVRQAYSRLIAAGTVIRYPARGSFVAPRIVEDIRGFGQVGFDERWQSQGYETSTEMLEYKIRSADPVLAAHFGVKEGQPLTYAERLRLANGTPMMWEYRYLPAMIHQKVSAEEMTQAVMTALLASCGIEADQTTLELQARPAQSDEAERLCIRLSDVVVVRRAMLLDSHGTAVLVGTSVYPAGRVVFTHRGPVATVTNSLEWDENDRGTCFHTA